MATIPAIVLPAANSKAETWVATITAERVKLWAQDDYLINVELSRDDLLQILAVLNGAARDRDGRLG